MKYTYDPMAFENLVYTQKYKDTSYHHPVWDEKKSELAIKSYVQNEEDMKAELEIFSEALSTHGVSTVDYDIVIGYKTVDGNPCAKRQYYAIFKFHKEETKSFLLLRGFTEEKDIYGKKWR